MNDFDLLLTRALQNRAQDAHPDPYLYRKIQTEYHCRKEARKMKFRTKKIIAIAAALCLLTASCFAAVQYAIVEIHSSADITSYAALEGLEKELGFDAKHVESFSNGFGFERGAIGVTTHTDGSETRLLTISYQNAQGGSISLQVEPILSVEEGYSTQVFKFVPPDYRPTAEDAAMEASGEIVLSYGSDEVENKTFESYAWQDGGLYYSLAGFDLDMGEEKLAAMAAEIK